LPNNKEQVYFLSSIIIISITTTLMVKLVKEMFSQMVFFLNFIKLD